MIKFTLRCEADHAFESWFPDGDAFDTQAKRGLVVCPACGTTSVAKALMTPAIGRSGDLVAAEMRAGARRLRAAIIEGTQDVGADFPAEARRIHDGDAPERPIRGQASPEEARTLLEDGIAVLPLPSVPDERN